MSISVLNAEFENDKIQETIEIDKRISQDLKVRILKKKQISIQEERTSLVPKIYARGLFVMLNTKKGTKGFVDNSKVIKLSVTVKFDRVKKEIPNMSMSVDIDSFGESVVRMNGKVVNQKDIEQQNKGITKRNENYLVRKKENIRKALSLFKMSNPLVRDSQTLDKAIEEGKDSFELLLKKGDIENLVSHNKKLLTYISLAPIGVNLISDAMLSTKIKPHALNYSNRRGNSIGIYMSEWNGCPDNSQVSNYMRLGEDDNDSHGLAVANILRNVSPLSYIYCRRTENASNRGTLPLGSDRLGYNGHPQILVESYSYAKLYQNATTNIYEYTNEYQSEDKDHDNEVLNNMIVIVGAGNSDNYTIGSSTINTGDNISSPAKGFNVITVGNYNDSTNTIASNSCYLDPEIGIDKPEVSAPGVTIDTDQDGTDNGSGTSYSAPHVAGFASDLLSRHTFLQLKPELFKAHLMASARKPITGGIDKVGVGGVDFLDAVGGASIGWWRGNTFSYFASHDGGSDSSTIERTAYISAGTNVRVAISWLNDGDYTLANKQIGKDYDLYVYGPNGYNVGSSLTANNSYETINFNAAQSGNYRFVVHEFINRDVLTKTYLGMSINW